MSREIDEKIVQMKFENGQFEKGIQTSIHSLEELKKGLDFKDASKGLENLDKSAKGLKFDGLSAGIEALNNRFTLLGITGLNVMNRLSNAAINTGVSLVKNLSIDQVSTGWQKYADKTKAMQTIMSATAKEFSDTEVQMKFVNDQLNNLNWFTDETSYSFLDMVSNIGKFTSNNIPLEQAVTSMQGIANWAAQSGAGVNEASRAMYNLSQAIASGSLRLMDWMSIENANMGTARFKETVIDTALEMGTLKKRADGVITTMKGLEVTTGNFRSILTEGWITSDVLISTLEKYGAATNRIKELVDQTGVSTSKLLSHIDDYTDSYGQLTTASSKLGKTQEDTLKIFNKFTPSIKNMANVSKNAGVSVSALADAVIQYSKGTLDMNATAAALGMSVGEVEATLRKFQAPMQQIESIVSGTSVSVGQFATYISKYSEGSFDLAEVSKELGLSIEETRAIMDEFQTDTMKFGLEAFKAAKEVKTLSEALNTVRETVQSGWMQTFELIFGNYEEAKELWTNVMEILSGIFAGSAATRNEMFGVFKQMGGSSYVVASIYNALESVVLILGAVKKAWRSVFPPQTAESLFKLSQSLYQFTKSLKLTENSSKELQKVLRTVFLVLDTITYVLKQSVKSGFSLLNRVLKEVNIDISGFTDGLLGGVESINKYVKTQSWMTKAIDSFGDILVSAIRHIKSFIAAVREFGPVKTVIDALHAVFTSDFNGISSIITFLGNTFSNFINLIATTPMPKSLEDIQKFFVEFGETISKEFNDAGLDFSAFDKLMQSGWAKIIETMNLFVSGVDTAKKTAGSAIDYISSLLKEVDWSGVALLATGVTIVYLINKIADSVIAVSNSLLAFTNIGKKIQDVLKGVASVLTSTSKVIDATRWAVYGAALIEAAVAVGILSAALTVMSKIPADDLNHAAFVLGVIAVAIVFFTDAIGKLPNTNKATAYLLSFAALMGTLALAMNALDVSNPNEVWEKIKFITIFLAEVSLVCLALTKIDKDIKIGVSSMLGIAAALWLMLKVVDSISKYDQKELFKALPMTAALILVLTGISRLMNTVTILDKDQKAVKAKTFRNILAIVIGLYAIVHVIEKLGTMNPEVLVVGVLGLIPVMGSVLLLLKSAYLAGLYAEKAGLMILEISIALNLLIPAVKKLADLPLEVIVKGSAAITALSQLVFKPLVRATKDAGPNAAKAGLMLLSMAGAMAILQLVVKTLGKIDLASLAKGTTAVSILMLSLVPAIEAMGISNAETIKGFGKLTTMIGVLGAIIFVLAKFTDTTKALAAAASISAILMTITVPLHVLDSIEKPNLKTLFLLVGVVGLLGGIVIALSRFTENGPKAIMAAAAMSGILIALAASLKIMDKTEMPSWDKGTSMIALVGIIGGIMIGLGAVSQAANPVAVLALTAGFSAVLLSLAYSVKIMSQTKSKPSLANAKAMSLFVLAIGGVMAGLGIISQWADPVASLALATGMSEILVALGLSAKLMTKTKMPDSDQTAQLVGFAAVIGIIVAALSNIADPASVIPLATGIGELIMAMSASVWLMSAVKDYNVPTQAITQMITFAILSGVLIGVLSNIVKPDTVLPVATGLSLVMLSMAGVVAILGIVPAPNIMKATNALGALTIFVGGMGLLLTALGAIAGDSNAAQLIQGGGKILKEIGIAIGGFIGGILGGFIGGAIDGIIGVFPGVCESLKEGVGHLVEMMISLQQTPLNILDLLGTVTGVVAAITAAEFISGLEAIPVVGALIKEGKQNLTENFKALGQAIMGFAEEVDGIKAYQVKAAAEAVAALATATQAIPTEGGLFGMLFGNIDMDSFVTNVPKLGQGLADFAAETEGITAKTVEGAVNAATMLIELEKALPRQGGKLQVFLGEQDIGQFGSRLVMFGLYLAGFSNLMAAQLNTEGVENAKTAGQMMVDLENSLPREGGVLQNLFLGNKDIGKFGSNLSLFGDGLVALATKCAELSIAGISRAVYSGKQLANLENSLTKESGGALEFWFGGASNFKSFGENIAWFGEGLRSLSNKAKLTDFSIIDKIVSFIKTLGDVGDIGTDTKKLADAILALCNSITTTVKGKNKEMISQGKELGSNLVKGIIQGMSGNGKALDNAISGIAKSIVTRFEEDLKIHSPSVVMTEEGYYIVQGVTEGIEGNTSAEEAASQKAQNIVDAFQTIFDKADLKINFGNVNLESWQLGEGRGANWSENLQHELEAKQNELAATEEKVRASYAKYITLRQSGANEKTLKEAEIEFIEMSNAWKTIRNDIIDAQIESAESMIEELDQLDEVRQAEYDRWLSTKEGKNASSAEKTAKEMELLVSQLDSLAQTTAVLRSKHQAIVDEFGSDSTEARNAYIKVLNTEQKLNEQYDSIMEKQKGSYETIRQARDAAIMEYSAFMDEIAPKLLEMGFTMEQVEEQAKRESKFDQAWGKDIAGGYTQEDLDRVMTKAAEPVNLVKEKVVDIINDGSVEAITVKVVDTVPVAIKNVTPKVKSATKDLMGGVVDEIEASAPAVQSAFENTMLGAVKGIYSSKPLADSAMAESATSALQTVKDVFQEKSPSKAMMKIGAYAMEGLAIGINQNGSSAVNAMENQSKNVIDGAALLTSRLSAAISNDMDLTPTITPVLDMDNVLNGSKKISGILNANAGLDVRSIDLRTKQLQADLKADGTVAAATSGETVVNNNFTQNNYSPKALSRYDIYRQTRNQILQLKGVAPK